MELKRSITKRIRMRRSAAPESIEMPAKQPVRSPSLQGLGLSSAQSTPGVSVMPNTPRTPGTEEFASIPFDGVPMSSPPTMSSPSRSTRSARSSRSASVASSHFGGPLLGSPISGSGGGPPPPLVINTEFDTDPRFFATEPLSPDSESEVSEADEMAQHILAQVRQGGQQKWSL